MRKFYVRRFLRIWPLYFLLILLGFFLFPLVFQNFPGSEIINSEGYYNRIWLYIFILPNVASSLGIGAIELSHLWSIGVEEQFYYIWPVLLKKFRNNIMLVMVSIVFLIVLLPHILKLINLTFFDGESVFMDVLWHFFVHFRISAMALGGIAAYLFFTKNRLLKIVYNKYFSFGLLYFLIFSAITHLDIPADLYSFLFAIFILDISTNPSYPISLEFEWVKYLGKISYGLYMYHWLIIIAVLEIVTSFLEYSIQFNLLVYFLPIGLTILVSGLSYTYFEKYFIEKKKRFTIIKSRAA